MDMELILIKVSVAAFSMEGVSAALGTSVTTMQSGSRDN